MNKAAAIFYKSFLPMAQSAAAGTKIFAETILSAAALESRYGQSVLATKYNNLFGIKADPIWKGRTVILPTYEFINGRNIKVNASFRVYNSVEDSFKSYVQFISGPRYQKAGVLAASSPQQQFRALARAGYATTPNYESNLNNRFNELYSNIKKFTKDPGAMGTIAGAIAFFIVLNELTKNSKHAKSK